MADENATGERVIQISKESRSQATMDLQDEILARSREIHTDRYSMAINEANSMYESGDLEVHPEFQRIFRWTIEQQSRLIESVFLGIPIPPIFVAARSDGVWDVVDGVQRLSTLLRFMGALKGSDAQSDSPEPLMAGEYLKGLKGLVWDMELFANGPHENLVALTDAQQRFFKRARLDFQIIQHTSDEQAKFDLFQRLNSGTRLSEQEARNCLAVMLDPSFYRWLQDLAGFEPFDRTVDISERQERESYGAETSLRFLAIVTASRDDLVTLGDVGEFLTNRMREFISSDSFDRDYEAGRFKNVFMWLDAALGSSVFKRYDAGSDQFKGKFSISAFEAVTTGVRLNYEYWESFSEHERTTAIIGRVKQVWGDAEFRTRTAAGTSANLRIRHLVELGRRIFSE
jgi:hypothetical protein